MNHARILIGGLVAGLILNIGEFLLNGVVLAKQMDEVFFRKCGLPMPGPSAFVILIVATFVLGISSSMSMRRSGLAAALVRKRPSVPLS